MYDKLLNSADKGLYSCCLLLDLTYSIIIVRMPAEMRTALNKFFEPHHYKMKRRSTREKLDIFRKKSTV